MKSKVILLGLNEINFEFVKAYCAQGLLPHFKKFTDRGWTETVSENEYKLLEPWIQWVTVYTGKAYAEHQVFRLGDIVERKDLTQIFEVLEAEQLKVAAVSPFNADNRLQQSPFFIPDPWTKTPTTGSKLLKELAAAIQQTVNDNAQSKVTAGSIWSLVKGMMAFVSPSRYANYLSLMSKIRKPGVRAMILDNLLTDVFVYQWKKHQPDFANLFLNAGAHIQHHYLFNSRAYKGTFKNPEWYCPEGFDPLLLVLQQYDQLLEQLGETGATIYLATGLHQRPHEHLTYYWRLKNHAAFMKRIGIEDYTELLPRMSRDFLVKFATPEAAQKASQQLASFEMTKDGEKIFEVDNRGNSLFVELVYPNDMDDQMSITNGQLTAEAFKQFVSFVAIKNGEHDGTGYLLSNNGLQHGTIPLTQVYDILKNTCLKEEDAMSATMI
jgi:hypothetical protein